MEKYYAIITNKKIHSFKESCLYNAKKYAKSWLITLGFNPKIIKYRVEKE